MGIPADCARPAAAVPQEDRLQEVVRVGGPQGGAAYHQFAKEVEEAFRAAEAALAAGATAPIAAAVLRFDIDAAARKHAEAIKVAERDRRADITRRAVADPDAFWRGAIVPIPIEERLPSAMTAPRTVQTILAKIYALELEARIVAIKAILEVEDYGALDQRFRALLPDEASDAHYRVLADAELAALQSMHRPFALFPGSRPMPALTANSLPPPQAGPTQQTRDQPAASDINPLMSAAISLWLEAERRDAGWSDEYAHVNEQRSIQRGERQ